MIRIGELAKRAGVSPEVLRAWERRYALVTPARSEGGFRLYSEADVARIRRMRELIGAGMSAAEAARAARDGAAAEPRAAAAVPAPAELATALRSALASFDDDAAQYAIDRLLGAVTVETFLGEVALPVLREIGAQWEAGRTSVGHEHFATTVIRGRLLGLARGWDRGPGRRAALACLPGELHDAGLVAFGIVLARNGWRILYFGQDTPLDSLREDTQAGHASLVVVSSVDAARFADHVRPLRALARTVPLAIGGAGASERTAAAIHARLLPADPVAAAKAVSEGS